MIQGRSLLRLAKKPAAVLLVLLQPRRHALDGYHAFQLGILRLIDLPHAACAQQLRNHKPPCDGSGEYRNATGRRRERLLHRSGQKLRQLSSEPPSKPQLWWPNLDFAAEIRRRQTYN